MSEHALVGTIFNAGIESGWAWSEREQDSWERKYGDVQSFKYESLLFQSNYSL